MRPTFCLVLDTLAKAGDQPLLDRLIQRVPAAAFTLCDGSQWSGLFQAFGAAAFAKTFHALISEGAEKHRTVLFSILDALRQRKQERPAVQQLLDALAALSPRQKPAHWDDQDAKPPGSRRETRIFLLASALSENAKLRARLRVFLLADQTLSYFREILVPVLLDSSVVSAGREEGSLIPELAQMVKSALEKEIARPNPPFPDWRRPMPIPAPEVRASWMGSGLNRELLAELSNFMADPEKQSHDFKRTQDLRQGIEAYIARHRLDLDLVTITKGSPHTLRCTKNEASHHAALRQHRADKQLLAKICKAF